MRCVERQAWFVLEAQLEMDFVDFRGQDRSVNAKLAGNLMTMHTVAD